VQVSGGCFGLCHFVPPVIPATKKVSPVIFLMMAYVDNLPLKAPLKGSIQKRCLPKPLAEMKRKGQMGKLKIIILCKPTGSNFPLLENGYALINRSGPWNLQSPVMANDLAHLL
jgi:hypothetical protein